MNKENVCVNRFRKLWGVLSHSWKFWLLISILIIVLIFEFVLQPMIEKRDYYLNYEINELYSHTTSQGYEVVVYEIGHPTSFWTSRHRIGISVDGVELITCTLVSDYGHKESLFSKQDIACTKDTDEEYVLNLDAKQTTEYRFVRFSADFKQVIDVCAYEININSDLEVIECHEADLFG